MIAGVQRGLPDITIAEMTAADLPRVRELARQLGYPDSPAALQDRFRLISALDGHKLLTVRAAGAGIIGWMHLCLLTPLEAPPSAQISAVVVDETWRGKGVGRMLVAHAEEWAAQRGLSRVTLRSRHDRDAAHAFYLGQGFAATKTSVVFEKELK